MKFEFKTSSYSDDPIVNEILTTLNDLVDKDLNPISKAESLAKEFSSKIVMTNYEEIFLPFEKENLIINKSESGSNDRTNSYPEAGLVKLLEIFIFYLKYYLRLPLEDLEKHQFHGINRISAPPKEAYKYSGHNKMDILDSKKGYSLLLD